MDDASFSTISGIVASIYIYFFNFKIMVGGMMMGCCFVSNTSYILVRYCCILFSWPVAGGLSN